MLRCVTVFFFCLLTMSIKGQEKTVIYAKKVVHELCNPNFEGRGYVQNGCNKAGYFLDKEFKRLGLNSVNGKTCQEFYLNVNTFPGRCKVKFGGRKLRAGIDYLIHPSSSGFDGNFYTRVLTADQILNLPLPASFGRNEAIAYVPRKNITKDSLILVKKKLEKLALTKIPIIEYTRDKLTWSVSSSNFKSPYIQCFDTNYTDVPKKINIHLEEEFLADYLVKNYFGIVPSKTRTNDSLIVVCAHYDHLGRMGKNTYFPGANDNASGVAMMLSIAREISKNPLANHSVLFIAFAGEEIGLEGSTAFVNSNIIDLKKISLVLNLDILGSGEDGITVVNGSVFPKFYSLLNELNIVRQAVPIVKSRGKAANSDHYPFSEKGVPSIFVYTMGPNKNYHDINDTYQNLTFDRFESLYYLFIDFLYRL